MITSMTAYAKQEKSDAARTISIEIRSYNSKYMDLVLRSPHGYDAFEERIRGTVKDTIVRGRVEIRLHIQENMDEAMEFEVNQAQAKAYYKALLNLKETLQLKEDITISHIASCNGLISVAGAEKNIDAAWPIVESCLKEALRELMAMREREGAYLQQDFMARLEEIERHLEHIEQVSVGMIPHYQERLRNRIESLTQGIIEIDPARIAQEAAFLADRSDISEEIVRAKSHLNQFLELMQAVEPAGRKLNFLLQELNREFTTMGSKAGIAEIAHTIVTVKAELEKIREQVQNVE